MDNNIDKEKLINDFIASSGKKEFKLSISDEEANIELDCSYEEIQNIALAFSNHHGIYQCSLCKQIFNLPADYDDYNVRLCKECNDKVVFPLPKNVEEELAKYKEYSTKDFYRNLDYLKNKYEDNNRLIVYLIYNIDKRKYYIGESRGNVAERIQSHFEGNGNCSIRFDYG
ncbi:MAG: GIY-YIG nuclease family protein [Ruminococcus flavefaciens]